MEKMMKGIPNFYPRGSGIVVTGNFRYTAEMCDWTDWGGHWQVIIGIDTCETDDPYDDVLIMADPYDVTDHNKDGYFVVPLGRFFYMWREGICAHKSNPYEQPFVVAKIKKEVQL